MVTTTRGVAIPEAANYLSVTTKTVRNYIGKGLLEARKWNGAWRIDPDSLETVAVLRRGRVAGEGSRGTGAESAHAEPSGRDSDALEIGRAQGALQEAQGALQEARERLSELTAENRALHERIERLEAAASSEWAELRVRKEQAESASARAEEAEARVSKALQENQRLEASLGKAAAKAKLLEKWLQEEEDARKGAEAEGAEIRSRRRLELLEGLSGA